MFIILKCHYAVLRTVITLFAHRSVSIRHLFFHKNISVTNSVSEVQLYKIFILLSISYITGGTDLPDFLISQH